MLSSLLACCMDKKMLKKHGINYLKNNKDLVMDVLAPIDIVKVLLEVQLNFDLKSLDHTSSLLRCELESEEQYNEMAKVLSRTLTDKDCTEVVSVLNTQLSAINKPLSNAEPRSLTKFLKSKHARLRQLPGCDFGAMVEEVVVIPGEESIVPSNKKRKVASMTSIVSQT